MRYQTALYPDAAGLWRYQMAAPSTGLGSREAIMDEVVDAKRDHPL
jgi:hypothetical protein